MGELYQINGWYEQDRKDHPFEGKIYANNNILSGEIKDFSSPFSERKLRGLLKRIDNKSILELIVNVPSDNLCNIKYTLSKPFTGNFSGTYSGRWEPVSKRIDSRVISGPHQTHTGEDIYHVEVTNLIPKNREVHPVKIIVKRLVIQK